MARAAAVLCIVGHGFRADAMAALRMAPSAARDHAFMGMALEEAALAAAAGEVPVGAVVVDDASGAVTVVDSDKEDKAAAARPDGLAGFRAHQMQVPSKAPSPPCGVAGKSASTSATSPGSAATVALIHA